MIQQNSQANMPRIPQPFEELPGTLQDGSEAQPVELSEIADGKEAILNGAVTAAEVITNQFPQVSEDGKLGYYFSGSLAAMLLSRATSIEPLNTGELPSITPAAYLPMSPEARGSLQAIARPIGDIDVAVLSEYADRAEAEIPDYDPNSPDAYQEAASKWITHGATPPLPESCAAAFKGTKLDTETDRSPARIVVDGQEFYIADPLVMLQFKAAHLVIGFTHYKDKTKLVGDFTSLVEGLGLLYPPGEMKGAVHEALAGSSKIVLPTYDPRLGPVAHNFLGEVVAMDENADYIRSLTIGPERSMGILNILRHYDNPEVKQAIVDFVSDNWRQINQWQINTGEPQTRAVVADYVRQNPAQFSDEPNLDIEDPEPWLAKNTWAIQQIVGQLPPDSGAVYQPVENEYLSLLTTLDEAHISQELTVFGKLLNTIPRPKFGLPIGAEVGKVFNSTTASDPAVRRALFEGIDQAFTQFDEATAQEFFRDLSGNFSFLGDMKTREEHLTALNKCFSKYNLLFNPET